MYKYRPRKRSGASVEALTYVPPKTDDVRKAEYLLGVGYSVDKTLIHSVPQVLFRSHIIAHSKIILR